MSIIVLIISYIIGLIGVYLLIVGCCILCRPKIRSVTAGADCLSDPKCMHQYLEALQYNKIVLDRYMDGCWRYIPPILFVYTMFFCIVIIIKP